MEVDREYLVMLIKELCSVLGIKDREVIPAPARATAKRTKMVMTVPEFAELTGIPASTVYGLIKQGALRNVAPENTRRCLIPSSEVEKFR